MSTMTNSLASMSAPEDLEDGIHYAVGFGDPESLDWHDTGAITIADGMIDETKLIQTAIRIRTEVGLPYRQVTGLTWDASIGIFIIELSEDPA